MADSKSTGHTAKHDAGKAGSAEKSGAATSSTMPTGTTSGTMPTDQARDAADTDPRNEPGLSSDQRRAAEKRREALANVSGVDRNMVDGLLAERRGYQQRGDTEGVDAVNEQLKSRGYDVNADPGHDN